jgi:hypothetical protein
MKKSMKLNHKTQNDHKHQVAHKPYTISWAFFARQTLNKWKEEDRMLEPLIRQVAHK